MIRVCNNVFRNGIANVMAGYPASMKPSMNCTFEVDGKIAYVAQPEDNAKTIALINELPRYNLYEIGDAPDGIYTWIMYRVEEDGDRVYRFAFRPVRSILEVGTIHKAVARAVNAKTVHGAGEFKKEGTYFEFNFLSGSFMINQCNLEGIEQGLAKLLEKKFEGKPFRVGFTNATLITMKPTMDELQFYANKGYRVCLHDKEKVDECKSVKGTCENALLPQEGAMRGGDENLMIQGKAIQPASQASKARQVFASKGLIARPRTPKEKALTELAQPITPQSVGLGRKRKTRRGKKARRTTRKRL